MPADKEQAIAHCAWCAWKATIHGDDMIDIVKSIRKILIAHITVEHPERATGTGAIIYRQIDSEHR